jgi:hypothetical protein
MVAIGVATTIGLVLVADSIDDHIDRTGPVLADPTSAARRGLIEIKF